MYIYVVKDREGNILSVLDINPLKNDIQAYAKEYGIPANQINVERFSLEEQREELSRFLEAHITRSTTDGLVF